MHVHIAMMGETIEPVMKSFQALGYDVLYIVTNRKYEGSLKSVIEGLTPFPIRVESRFISGFDFQEIVDTIYDIYEKEKGRDVTFSINITGGTNMMAAASCSCAFFIGATIYYVLRNDSPVKEQVVEVPTPRVPDISSLRQETKDILRYIRKMTDDGNPVTTDALMGEFGKTKQSLNHQINILRREGLVENGELKDGNGNVDRRYRTIVLTRQGRLVASWI